MSRFCEHCGAQLNDGAKFCPECGKRLNSGSNLNFTGWLYENFLRHDGRLNRWNYFKMTIFSSAIGIFAALLLMVVLVVFDASTNFITNAIIITMLAVIFYLEYGLIIRRCHDLKEDSLLHWCIANDDTAIAKFTILMGIINGALTLWGIDEHFKNLVDTPNMLIGLYLLLAPGENGMNRYDTVD